MEHRHNADVLVVGLGPAGCAAAVTAAEAGLRVAAIDARTHLGSPPHCGEFIPARLFGEIPKDPSWIIQSVDTMESVVLEGAAGASSSDMLRVRSESPGFIIDRARFDRDYGRRAAGAGAFLLCAARLTDMDGDTSLVRRGGDFWRFSAKLTIAADGAMSTVGRLLGFTRPTTLIGAQREIPLKRPLSHTTVVMAPWIVQGYGWLFPKGRVANVGVGIAMVSGARPNDVLDELVGRFRDDGLIGRGELARYRGLIPVSGPRSTTVNANTLFCGDAAGLTHPITGAGVPQAVVSGRLAGLAAIGLIRDGRTQALAEYEHALRVRFSGPLRHAASKRGRMEARWGLGEFEELCRETWIGFKGYRARVRG